MAEMETSVIVAAPLREVFADLEHFKEFIEDRERATGTWRGEIHGHEVETPRV